MRLLGAFIALLALSGTAQAAPGNDPRYQTFDYAKGGIFQLSTATGTSQMVFFAKGERIRSVVLSDPSAYSIDIGSSGDSVTLKANGLPGPTMMTVQTDLRNYDLELLPASGGTVPQVINFSYASGASGQASQSRASTGEAAWRLSGKKALRPVSISDDGEKTFIAWDEKQPMPAVFAIGVTGDEEMVEGYVRAGVFTIDRVYDELMFRIDRQSAKARRVIEKKRSKHD